MAQFIRIEDWEAEEATAYKPVVWTLQAIGETNPDKLYQLVKDLVDNSGFNMATFQVFTTK